MQRQVESWRQTQITYARREAAAASDGNDDPHLVRAHAGSLSINETTILGHAESVVSDYF